MAKDILANGSLPSQLAALSVGETFTKAVRLDGDTAVKQDVIRVMKQLTGHGTSMVHRAKARIDGDAEFVIETFETRTRSYDILVGVAITRTR